MQSRMPPAEPPLGTVADEIVHEVTPARIPEPSVTASPEQVLKLDWQTDLTQIETSPEKVQAARMQVVEEAPPPRPKRVRPALPSVEEGPLLQVETQHPDAARASGA